MAKTMKGESDENKPYKLPSGKMGKRIYRWPVVGSTRVAGAAAKYTVMLWTTGEVTCDCPGWIIYHKKNGGCKHTNHIRSEAQDVFRLWEQGKDLPSVEQEFDPGTQLQNSSNPKPIVDDSSKIRYGRFIQLD